VIDDVNYGGTINTDSVGVLSNYDNRASWMAGLTMLEGTANGTEAVRKANGLSGYDDTAGHDLEYSYSLGPFLHILQVIASGTSTLGSGSLSATSRNSAVTTTATGVASTDAIEWSYASAPSGSTDGKLILSACPTSGNVNFLLCNPTPGGLFRLGSSSTGA
jgi:hypothetical protein